MQCRSLVKNNRVLIYGTPIECTNDCGLPTINIIEEGQVDEQTEGWTESRVQWAECWNPNWAYMTSIIYPSLNFDAWCNGQWVAPYSLYYSPGSFTLRMRLYFAHASQLTTTLFTWAKLYGFSMWFRIPKCSPTPMLGFKDSYSECMQFLVKIIVPFYYMKTFSCTALWLGFRERGLISPRLCH